MPSSTMYMIRGLRSVSCAPSKKASSGRQKRLLRRFILSDLHKTDASSCNITLIAKNKEPLAILKIVGGSSSFQSMLAGTAFSSRYRLLAIHIVQCCHSQMGLPYTILRKLSSKRPHILSQNDEQEKNLKVKGTKQNVIKRT